MLLLWTARALVLAAAAVLASLATEVFPKTWKLDRHGAGIAISLGLIAAYGLYVLGHG